VKFRADANIRGGGVKSRGDKAFAFESCAGPRPWDLLRFFRTRTARPAGELPTAIPTELGRRGRQSPATPESRTFSEKYGLYVIEVLSAVDT